MNVTELRLHALSLAGGIKVEEIPGTYPSQMYVAEQRIVVAPVTDTPTYYQLLHEIAHCRLGHTDEVYYAGVLKAEREAWAWAAEHSAIAPDEAMRAYADWCMGTYQRAAALAGGKPTRVQRPGGPSPWFTFDAVTP